MISKSDLLLFICRVSKNNFVDPCNLFLITFFELGYKQADSWDCFIIYRAKEEAKQQQILFENQEKLRLENERQEAEAKKEVIFFYACSINIFSDAWT